MLKGRRYITPMLIAFLLGCLPKAVYAPVILMGIAAATVAEKKNGVYFSLSQRKTDHEKNKDIVNCDAEVCDAEICDTETCDTETCDAEACDAEIRDKEIRGLERKHPAGSNRGVIIISILLFAFLIAAFILPTVIDPSESGDIRGGAVSEMSQIGFILSEPLSYAAILFSQMIRWSGKCFFGADCMTFMGHIVNGSSGFKGYYPAYMLMTLMVIAASYYAYHLYNAENKDAHKESIYKHEVYKNVHNGGERMARESIYKHEEYAEMTPSLRLTMLLAVIISSVLIWTAM